MSNGCKAAVSLLFCLAAAGTQAKVNVPPALGARGTSVQADEMTRMYIPPERILWVSGDSSVHNSDLLLRSGTRQAEMNEDHTCTLHTEAGDTASVLLDFGKELHGGLHLSIGEISEWNKPSYMRIRFGESVSEACSENDRGKRRMGLSTNDHAIRDMVLQVPCQGSIEVGNTGFRFVRIDWLGEGRTVHLKETKAILRCRDIPYIGSFRCNDQRLNDIWMTGAYTVHLNMQEYLWDGIKRDRYIWLGDMHPEVSTIMTVFGQNEVVPQTLDWACERYPLPHWLNDMSSYSMWYLIILHDWYLHGGDLEYLKRHRGYITGLIDLIDGCVDEDGNEHLSDFRFLDWPSTPNEKGVEAGYRALLVWAMQDGARLCEWLGEKDHAQRCKSIESRLEKRILPHNDLKQAAALMAISGLMPADKACREVISVGGAERFSTFYGFYMLQALAQAGEYQQAVDIIRQYWGGMLDLGATTFWEDFDLNWARNAGRLDEFVPEGKDDIHGDFGAYCYSGFRHSLCHGWASGPTPWMTRHILGIDVLEAGCRTLRIIPHLGDLEWAEGTFPTPLGTVYVKHVKDADGKVRSEIRVPEGVRVIRESGTLCSEHGD